MSTQEELENAVERHKGVISICFGTQDAPAKLLGSALLATKIKVYKNSIVEACDVYAPIIEAFDECTINANGGSRVHAYGKSKVYARDNSQIEAFNYSIVEVHDDCEVTAHDHAKVTAHDKCNNYV